VPKKKWRSSVKRHRIRRLMVEAWRLNKQPVYQAVPGDSQLHLFFLYTDATLPTQEDVTAHIIKLADKLVKELSLVNS
jgi:ribonuclease P protein component